MFHSMVCADSVILSSSRYVDGALLLGGGD